jgi:hypothetical protein
VVAALRVLREQGWIESQQGKGRFVRGRPARTSHEQNRPGQAYLTTSETEFTGEALEVGTVTVPNRVGALLGVELKSKAFVRRRLIAAGSGASLKDLMQRIGHDSDRAALSCQHSTAEADCKIADAMNSKTAEALPPKARGH